MADLFKTISALISIKLIIKSIVWQCYSNIGKVNQYTPHCNIAIYFKTTAFVLPCLIKEFATFMRQVIVSFGKDVSKWAFKYLNYVWLQFFCSSARFWDLSWQKKLLTESLGCCTLLPNRHLLFCQLHICCGWCSQEAARKVKSNVLD